ncbi:MAG: hypothetical protein ACOY0T_35615 [Myxococcota bacterium]
MDPAERGAADGTQWARRNSNRGLLSPLTVARAAGNSFENLVADKTLATRDAVVYSQAFINAALAELGDSCTWG